MFLLRENGGWRPGIRSSGARREAIPFGGAAASGYAEAETQIRSPTCPTMTSTAIEIRRISVEEIAEPTGGQTRVWFDEGRLRELADSLGSAGLLHPIVVRPGDYGRMELVAGARRLAAARRLGWTEIDAHVHVMTDGDALIAGLVADLAHEPLTLLERSWLTVRLREQLRADGRRCSYPVLAALLGVGEPTISEYVRTAEAIPRSLLLQRASAMGVTFAAAACLPRRVLRRIRGAPEWEREALIDTSLLALAGGEMEVAETSCTPRPATNKVRVEQDGSRLRLQVVLETPVGELPPDTAREMAEALAPAMPLLAHLGPRVEGSPGGSPRVPGVRRANPWARIQAWWRRWIARG